MTKDNTASLTTRELWARLFQAPSLDGFLAEHDASFELPTFAEYITMLAESKGEKPEKIIKRCNIERSFGHRLFTGARKPSRDTVLQLAFGFGLSPDDTQQLLKAAHMNGLHPKVKRDAIIAYCLYHKKTLIETQGILHDCALPLLGGPGR